MSLLLWVLLILVGLLGLAWVVLRILMMGKNGVLLSVRWSLGIDEDPKGVKWMQAPTLPKLLGVTSVTIGRKVCSRKTFAEASEGHKRHELRHVRQMAGKFLPWWLLQYVVIPSFRKHAEADAHAQEIASHPTWRIAGVVSSNWFLW